MTRLHSNIAAIPTNRWFDRKMLKIDRIKPKSASNMFNQLIKPKKGMKLTKRAKIQKILITKLILANIL